MTDLNTILIPEFNAPTAGTISVKIILKNELRGTSKEVQLYNGQSYTFLDNETLGWPDNYNVLYKSITKFLPIEVEQIYVELLKKLDVYIKFMERKNNGLEFQIMVLGTMLVEIHPEAYL